MLPINAVNHEVWIDPLMPRLPRGWVTVIAFYGHYPDTDGRPWPAAIKRCFAVAPSGSLLRAFPVLDRRSTARGGLGVRFEAKEPGVYQVCLLAESGWWCVARDGTWIHCKPEEAPMEYERCFHTTFLAKAVAVAGEPQGGLEAPRLGLLGELSAKLEDERIVIEAPAGVASLEAFTPHGRAEVKLESGRAVVEAGEHGFYLFKCVVEEGYERVISTLAVRL